MTGNEQISRPRLPGKGPAAGSIGAAGRADILERELRDEPARTTAPGPAS